MRPTDFCTPKHSNSNTHASPLPSAARLGSAGGLSAPSRGSLSYRTFRLVLVLAKRLLFAPLPARPKTRGKGTGKLGAARCERGWGESRFTARLPLRQPLVRLRGGVFFRRARPNACLWHLCRLLRARERGSRKAIVRAVARRPPRPVPRGPRERRALPRSEMPSLGSCLAQPARTEMRTNPRRLPRSHGAHVMWIAWLRGTAPLSPGATARAYARGDCLWLSPRSRASHTVRAFDPLGTDDALLWARRRSTDFCNTTMQGH
jgi:hypothetical protein